MKLITPYIPPAINFPVAKLEKIWQRPFITICIQGHNGDSSFTYPFTSIYSAVKKAWHEWLQSIDFEIDRDYTKAEIRILCYQVGSAYFTTNEKASILESVFYS